MSWDEYPQDIYALALVLEEEEETQRTARSLLGRQMLFENTWRTERTMTSGGQALPIPLPRNKALHPTNCQLQDADMRFIFVLGVHVGPSILPLQADFQVRIEGWAVYHNSSVLLEDHWRVDTHLYEDANEMHPNIHFQRGGTAQDGWAAGPTFLPGPSLPANAQDEWRALMQYAAPRVAFLPMCPVLAIDFVIGQHDGLLWRRLRGRPEYQQVVQRARERLWTPFFEALSHPTFRRRWLGY